MKLIEALTLANRKHPAEFRVRRFYLATGFTPLHLSTFLKAHLQLLNPENAIALDSGLFGDLTGNIARGAGCESLAVVIEWSDLDARLGLRATGGWSANQHKDIAESAKSALSRLTEAVRTVSSSTRVAIVLPTLPLPPVAWNPPAQAGALELELRQSVQTAASELGSMQNVAVMAPSVLDRISPVGARLDPRSELAHGFPYTQSHAECVASVVARLMSPGQPKKGLITDLDDTVWRGILGDDGVDGVSWDLASHTQVHGLYQQLLMSLADAGILIAVASKNDAALVDAAFDRSDILLKKESVFPIEAGWGPKSESVTRILQAWNIAADAVVFIDDSPIELAEVAARHSGIECLRFDKSDERSALDLFWKLRELFGKQELRDEDSLRLSSLRAATALPAALDGGGASAEQFLAGMDSEIRFEYSRNADDARALELINKTNQFNLNGRRYSPTDWSAYLANPAAFLLTVTYADKFGPLGKIAALLGRIESQTLRVDSWVMSCRAFSRRIEHRTLQILIEHSGAELIELDYVRTERNGPLSDFLAAFQGDGGKTIVASEFAARCAPLYQKIQTIGSLDAIRLEVTHG